MLLLLLFLSLSMIMSLCWCSLRPRPRICFVTAILGNYETTCKNPIKQTIPCDFIVFTDNPNIKTHGIWRVISSRKYRHGINENDVSKKYVNSLKNNTHNFNRSKFFKLNLHRIPELQGYHAVVWLDGTVQITNPMCAEICLSLIENGCNLATFDHLDRRGKLKGEVSASHFERYTSTHWNNQDQPYQDVDKQYEDYVRQGFVDVGVWITCFLLFDMRNPQSHQFLDEWWYQNLTYTTQDQISFPFVCWKMGIRPYTFPDGNINGRGDTVNDLYTKHQHGK